MIYRDRTTIQTAFRSWAPGCARAGWVAAGLTIFLAISGISLAQQSTRENSRIVDGLNDHLAQVRDMSADFVQILDDGLNQPQRQEGHLYLERSGRARWEYDYPQTRLYVVSGNVVTDYMPGENMLRRRSVDDETIERIPLMSVLGRRNLRDEFERIDLMSPDAVQPQTPGTRVLRLVPSRESGIEDIVLEVDPASFDIRRLIMRYRDGSTNDFLFSSILTNTGLTDGLWEVVPLPGTDVVDMVN